MSRVDFFLVTYDRLYDKVIKNLSLKELDHVTCYNIQKKVTKNISPLIQKQINEWELPWNTYDYQTKQFYEYGAIIHLYKNQHLLENTTHVGLLHYDVIYNVNSINEIHEELVKNQDVIFYQKIRPREQLSLSLFEVTKLCDFMSERIGVHIDPNIVWNNGWISESLSVTPKHVFLKFGEFLLYNGEQIEYILKNNIWGIMNHCPHRICGIVERMWGFYLMSQGLPLKQLNIIHDWDSYQHQHMSMNGTGTATI